mmetsp:Transcript_10514/g.8139  ORF Transcript_10514/g.8139 Transcript_10514/m.8139 type:complete len:100 (-) Transcript_10514:80-379(-)
MVRGASNVSPRFESVLYVFFFFFFFFSHDDCKGLNTAAALKPAARARRPRATRSACIWTYGEELPIEPVARTWMTPRPLVDIGIPEAVLELVAAAALEP